MLSKFRARGMGIFTYSADPRIPVRMGDDDHKYTYSPLIVLSMYSLEIWATSRKTKLCL